jgi:quercetin dioxygenase-like cupin family protein
MATDHHAAPALEGVIAQAALVDYQPGAVVSRTLLKTPAGTVTAFAFAAGEELSEHTAAFDALALVCEGDCAISIAGTAHKVSAGQLLRLPAGLPHAVKAVAPLKMILVMIRA